MPTTLAPAPARGHRRRAAGPRPVPPRGVASRGGALCPRPMGRSVGRVPRPAGGLEPTDARAGGGDRDRAARGFDLPIAHWGRGGGPPVGVRRAISPGVRSRCRPGAGLFRRRDRQRADRGVSPRPRAPLQRARESGHGVRAGRRRAGAGLPVLAPSHPRSRSRPRVPASSRRVVARSPPT